LSCDGALETVRVIINTDRPREKLDIAYELVYINLHVKKAVNKHQLPENIDRSFLGQSLLTIPLTIK